MRYRRCSLLALIASFLLVACSSVAPATEALPTAIPTPEIHNCYGTIPEGPPIALVGGVLIDGTGAEPQPDSVLVIEGCRIIAVGQEGTIQIPSEAQVVELSGATVLPGFIDAHVHNAYHPGNLQTWAQTGVTTVRDLGAPLGIPYFRMRDRLAGDPLHARVVSAGPLVTVPEGYPIVPNNFSSLALTSVEDARQQISQLIVDGAEVIKITLVTDLPSLSNDEAAAIVEVAHQQGIPVSAHATNLAELERALSAGVDDIAHIANDWVPDVVLEQMIDGGVAWVPTLHAAGGLGMDNLNRFVALGGTVAMGTDAGYLDSAGLAVGMDMEELALLQEAGMTNMQIIVAATRNGAFVCRLEEDLGTLEVGKLADILIVAGDPLEDLRALENVLMVIHGGVIIRDETD